MATVLSTLKKAAGLEIPLYHFTLRKGTGSEVTGTLTELGTGWLTPHPGGSS